MTNPEQGLTLVRDPVAEPAVLMEVLPEGWAIEKNPTPLAAVVVTTPTTESILRTATTATDGRFEPYDIPEALQGDTDSKVADEDIATLWQLVAEDKIIAPTDAKTWESDSEGQPQNNDERESRTQNFVHAVRRSRLGKVAAVAAVTASGALSFGAASASASSSVEDCVQKELVMPQVEKVVIHSPGNSGQATNVDMNVEEAPTDCHDVVDRLFQYEVIVKRSILVHDKLRRVTVRLARFNGNYFNRDEGGPFGGSFVANPHNPRELVKCSPGRANTTARLKVRGVITDSATDQEVGRKIWWGPVNIGRKKPC